MFVLLLLLHCFIFILVLSLCCVSRSSLYCNIPSDLCTLFVMLLLQHCFLFMLILLLCCAYRWSLYCNIPSDLCSLYLSCYYFYIVLSLYLYCRYVVYPDHHFTVIFIQTCVLLCMSCYYFYIVLSLYLYCHYVVYLDHHFTVISRQTMRGHHGPDYMVVGFTTTYGNQGQSSLIFWIRIPIREGCTTLCDTFVCDLRQLLVFSGSSGFFHQ
jgi:hypothetical protein